MVSTFSNITTSGTQSTLPVMKIHSVGIPEHRTLRSLILEFVIITSPKKNGAFCNFCLCPVFVHRSECCFERPQNSSLGLTSSSSWLPICEKIYSDQENSGQGLMAEPFRNLVGLGTCNPYRKGEDTLSTRAYVTLLGQHSHQHLQWWYGRKIYAFDKLAHYCIDFFDLVILSGPLFRSGEFTLVLIGEYRKRTK